MCVSHQTHSQEEYVPKTPNTLSDYSTPSELGVEPKSPDSDLTSSSDDEIVSPSHFYNAEDSDGEYSEFPFNSDHSRNDPSIKDKNRIKCLLCSRYFRNIHCFKLHV